MTQTYYYEGHAALRGALQEALQAAGFTPCKELQDADYVITYFPQMSQLEERYFGENGFMQSCKKGAYLIDFSPATPNFARELSAVASVSDLYFIEAPLAVSDVAVQGDPFTKDNMACCVAAEKADIEAVKPLLSAFVGAIHEYPEAGSAQLAHCAWTLQRVSSIVAAIEAEALYRALRRIPTSAAIASVGEVPALSRTQQSLLQAVMNKNYNGLFTAEMLMGEIYAALSTADDAELILPQAEACVNLLELLAVIGGADKAPSAIALVYDDEAAATAQGLSWARAEAYAHQEEDGCGCGCGCEDDECDCDGDCGDDCQCGGHGHGHVHTHAHAHAEQDFEDDDDDFEGYADLYNNYSKN